MARSEKGAYGPITGKLGPIVNYMVRGKSVVRMKPHIVKPRTEKQLATLQRMQVLSPFFNKINIYLRVGFELAAIENGNTANNSAKSYNLKNAIKGTYPAQEIDYPAIRLSQGTLSLPLNPSATAVENGVKFTWDFDQYDTNGSGYDRVMLMVYIPEKQLNFSVIGGNYRSLCEEILTITPSQSGLTAETYISFVTDDRSKISNSVYTGQVVL